MSSINSSLILAASGAAQGLAEYSKGRFEESQLRSGARSAELQAEDAIQRGRLAAARARGQAKDVASAQRVGFAGQGVESTSGTAREILAETKALGELDRIQIEANAYREAFGLRSEAVELRARGRMVRGAAKFGAAQTILGGGLQALREYERLHPPGSPNGSSGLTVSYPTGKTASDVRNR